MGRLSGANNTALPILLSQKSGSGTTLSGHISRGNRDGLHARAVPVEALERLHGPVGLVLLSTAGSACPPLARAERDP